MEIGSLQMVQTYNMKFITVANTVYYPSYHFGPF